MLISNQFHINNIIVKIFIYLFLSTLIINNGFEKFDNMD